VAFYAQLLTEDYYVANKFMKGYVKRQHRHQLAVVHGIIASGTSVPLAKTWCR
jgi:hypothetical protein